MDFGGPKSGEWDGGSGKRDRSDDDDHGQPSSKRESRRTLSDVARDTVVDITNTNELVPMDTTVVTTNTGEYFARTLPLEIRYKIYRGMSPSVLNNLRSSTTFFRNDIKGFESYTGVDSPMRTLINLSRTISPFADAKVEKTTEWHKYNAMRVMDITEIPNPLHALLYVSRMKALLTNNLFNGHTWTQKGGFTIDISRQRKDAGQPRKVIATLPVSLEPATTVVGSSVPWALTAIKFAYTDRESEAWRSKTPYEQLRDTIINQKDVWNAIKDALDNRPLDNYTMYVVLRWTNTAHTGVKHRSVQLGIWSVDLGNQDISDDMVIDLYDASQKKEFRDDKHVCGKISNSVFAVGSSTIYLHNRQTPTKYAGSSHVHRRDFLQSVPQPIQESHSQNDIFLAEYAKKILERLYDALDDRAHLNLRRNDMMMKLSRGKKHKKTIFAIVNIRDLYSASTTSAGKLMHEPFEYVDTTFEDEKYEVVRKLFSTDGNLYDMPLTLRLRKVQILANDKHIPNKEEIEAYVNGYSQSIGNSTFKDYRGAATRNRKSMGVLRDIGMTSGSKPPLCTVGCENYAAFNCGSHGCSVNYCSVQCADTDWVRGHGMVCRDE